MSIQKEIIKTVFNGMFKKWDIEKSQNRPGGIHASDLIKSDELDKKWNSDNRFCYRECVLKTFYQANNVESNEYLSRIFLNGWHLHQKWQQLLERYCTVVEAEKHHMDMSFVPVGFTPDAIIKMLGRDMVVEIKGYGADYCNELDEYGEAPESAEVQANLYCYFTGLKDAIILVENKNTQVPKVWHIPFQYGKVEHIVKRLENLKEYFEKWKEDNRVLPGRICKRVNCERAKKCSVSEVCFMASKDRQEMLLP